MSFDVGRHRCLQTVAGASQEATLSWQVGVGHRAFVQEGTLDLGLNHRHGTPLRHPEGFRSARTTADFRIGTGF